MALRQGRDEAQGRKRPRVAGSQTISESIAAHRMRT
jgi:hypothetical protein